MTLVATIIEEAFREGGLITELEHPTPTQTRRALERLQSIITSAYGNEVGEGLEDWQVGFSGFKDPDLTWTQNEWQYPAPNSRVLLNHTTAQTLYMPPDADNGARVMIVDVNNALATYPITLNGNGRFIDGAATALLNTAGLRQTWIYNPEAGAWTTLSTVASTGDMPFPVEFDDYFITKLAMRVNPRYGRSMDAQSIAALDQTEGRLRSRYKQRVVVPCDPGVLANREHAYRLASAPRRRKWMS